MASTLLRARTLACIAVVFAVLAGVIAAGSLVAGAGRTAAATPPANDNFDSATVISGATFADAVNTGDATLETGELQPCGDIGATAWYVYTPTTDSSITVTTAGSDFDTVLAAHGIGFSSPPGAISPLDCNDDAGGGLTTSSLTILAQAGNPMYFQAGGKAGATGNLQFHFAAAALNDDFSHASWISRHQTPTVDTTGATLEPGEQQPCGDIGATVWYEYQAPADFTITVTTAGSDFDTVLAAYTYGVTSPPGAAQNIACNDNASATDTTSSMTLDVVAGTNYYFQLGGKAGATGHAVLNIHEPPGGSISGTVRDTLGDPIAGAQVNVSKDTCCLNDTTTSGVDGTYTMTDLVPGTYSVYADAEGFTGAYFGGGSSAVPQAYVDVASGADVTGIDFALTPTGSIAGRVTDSDGNPITGAYVSATSTGCCGFKQATSGADGTYVIDDVDAGTYLVQVSAGGYATEFYDNTFDYNAATPVGVQSGATTSGIDFGLADGATISGVVRAPDGTPLAGASVYAQTVVCCGFGDGATTDSDGHYTLVDLAPGSYTVSAYASGYPSQVYDGVYDQTAATPITLVVGEAKTGIDFQMEAGGTITGTVTAGGAPVANAYVYASAPAPALCCGGGAITASDGTYSIVALAPASYVVAVSAQGYVNQYYDGASSQADATPVAVTSGGTASGIDFDLNTGGAIDGTVRDAQGTPLEGAYVYASGTTGGGGGDATTDSSGHYHIQGLADGSYIVFAQLDGYGGMYYGAVGSTAVRTYATAVAVTTGATATGIDIALPQAASISGTVTDGQGGPVAGALVRATAVCCADWPSQIAMTDATGAYTIAGLSPGSYRVQAGAHGYAPKYYVDAYAGSDAQYVTVAAGDARTAIDIALGPAATISGTVTTENGTPVTSGYVTAQSYEQNSCCLSTSVSVPLDASGHYTIGDLAPDKYYVYASAPGYPTQYYGGAYDINSAAPLVVDEGQTVNGIDFFLENGTLAGTVTANGKPVAGAFVTAQMTGCCGSVFLSGTTSGDGTYAIHGVPHGDYIVTVQAAGYAWEYYDNTPVQADATPVTVAAGGTTSGIDFDLTAGSGIEGTVRDSAGNPVAGAIVEVWNYTSYAFASTDSNGHYHFGGLTDPTYWLRATAHGRVTEYYPGGFGLSTARSVTVASGATTSGIDFTLPLAGSISGHVTYVVGQPSVTTTVYALSDAALGVFESTTPGAGGGYTLSGLPPGDYSVYVFAAGYRTQYYDHVEDPAQAGTVSLTEGAGVTGIDFALLPVGMTVTPTPTNTPDGTATSTPVATATSTPTATATATAAMTATASAPPTDTPVAAPPGYAIERIMPDLFHIDTSVPTVTTDVTVSDVTDLGAYEVEIEYDSSVVEFDSWTDGDFLGSTGKTLQCPNAVVTALNGTMKRLQAACGTLGPAAGPDGAGTLASITWRIVGPGRTDLALEPKLADPLGDPINAVAYGGGVIVDAVTGTATPTAAATDTPAPTDTATAVATDTPVPTPTDTPAPVATETPAATATDTPVPTATATDTPMAVATDTPVPTTTDTPVSTATATSVVGGCMSIPDGGCESGTATAIATASRTAGTRTAVVSGTASPMATSTITPTATATSTDTATPTSTDTATPTSTETPTATATRTSVPHTAVATATPSRTATALRTATTTSVSTVLAAERTSLPSPTRSSAVASAVRGPNTGSGETGAGAGGRRELIVVLGLMAVGVGALAGGLRRSRRP
ncbi:MAG TPA: carboxypeptidase regulatory-like domain-containing protein [Dehalococcoidia bacterium]|nr:carboxypeptidase regulatory-like domain-containing protein [Dehalococcoidia bacterium]